MSILYKFNLKNELILIRDEIIFEASKKRDLANYTYRIITEYDSYLYDILLNKCRSLFNFTLYDKDFKLYCLYNDKSYMGAHNKWHNHKRSSTINSVLYLKTVNGCGLKYCEEYETDQKDFSPEFCKMYENGRSIKYIEPKDFDLLIFPDYMMHTPFFPKDTLKDQTRVSLNLEIRCRESSIDIFNKKTFKYF